MKTKLLGFPLFQENPISTFVTGVFMFFFSLNSFGFHSDRVTDKVAILAEKKSESHSGTGNINKQVSINGTVTDENGMPLPGATVMERGGNNGTVTDFDGNFSLSVTSSEAVLVISYVGFRTQEVSIAGQQTISVSLEPEASALDEIVLIGYGEQARAKVVGAVGQIDGRELEKVAAPSIEQQLAGKMSGVIVNQNSGQPGAASQVVIRGVGTLTAGTNPLIVVDGFPLSEGSSLSSINPNDIKDINILKDAASAAIYGSRAANGVILVTTKKGATNEMNIALDMYTGFQEQVSGVELVDAYQHAQFLTEARNWGYVSKDPANRNFNDPNSVRVTKRINGQGIDGRELSLDYLQPYLDGVPGLTNTDWIDQGFRTAPMQNYNLSMSGGNDKTRYYTSLGFYDQEGVVVGTDYERYSASINLESDVHEAVTVGVNLKPSYSTQNSGDQASRSSGVLALSLLNFPMYSPYNEDGTLNISDQIRGETRRIEGVGINGTPVENLLATALNVKDEREHFRTFGNFFVDADLFEDLNYRLSVGGDYDSYTRNQFYPSDVGEYRIPAPRTDASAHQTKETKINYLVENTLNYSKTIGNHSFDFLVGHSFQKERRDYSRVSGTGFPDNNIQNIAGASSHSVNSSLYTWTLESYLGRFQYDFDDKYLVSIGFRRDGSSRFGSNNRWGNFPSFSAGWVLSEEDFYPTNDFLAFTKLSFSWGKTGNNQIGNYSSQALVTNQDYLFGGVLAPGYITTSAPNPNLGWEIATSVNVGLDLGLIQDKLRLGVAYYKTNTEDLLLDVPVPRQTGYNTVLANIGEMENTGLEFQLSGHDFNIGAVKLGFNANLTTYDNKVLALGPGQERIATGTNQNFITQIGRPIAEIHGFNITGVFKSQEEIDSNPHLNGTLVGDYKIEDANGDGIINEDDKISKGTFSPDFTYGFGGDVQYRGLTFSFNFMGVGGRTMLDTDMAGLTESGEGFGVPTTYYFNNRWHPENNPDGFLGRPNFGNFSNNRKLTNSSIVVEENNGDYLRLRDVRLSYDFQESVLKSLNLTGLNVYVAGNNLFTATDYRGWNVDGTSSNILASGQNNGSSYPVSRTILMGLKIRY